MKVLFIGDVVGSVGRKVLAENLPQLKKKLKPQVTIVNGENAAGGKGITEEIYKQFLQMGVDVVTMGNHTWDNRDIFEFIDDVPNLIRPANYPDNSVTPGKGMTFVRVNQEKLAFINLHGRSFMKDFESPFKEGEKLVKEALEKTNYVFIDFHAETTSEKEALGWFMDGKVSAIVGTHTHVQTNDHRILPQGTAYITDVGMTGYYDGILGMNKESILDNFLTQMPQRFSTPDSGRKRLNGCFVEIDKNSGKAQKIRTIRIDDDNPYFE